MSDYSPFKGTTGFKRILNATGYSLAGFKAAFQNEAAFRQIVLINVILIPITFFLDINIHEVVCVDVIINYQSNLIRTQVRPPFSAE